MGGNFSSARECAINLATYLKQNPPVPLDKSLKARRSYAARCLVRFYLITCAARIVRAQRKKKDDDEEQELGTAVRPAWVIDNNTYTLWARGCNEDMMPKEIIFTPETKAQLERMLEWAAGRAAELEQAEKKAKAERLLPSPPPLRVTAQLEPLPGAGAGSSLPTEREAFPFVPSQSIVAMAKALAAGPRVGPSPTSIMQA